MEGLKALAQPFEINIPPSINTRFDSINRHLGTKHAEQSLICSPLHSPSLSRCRSLEVPDAYKRHIACAAAT